MKKKIIKMKPKKHGSKILAMRVHRDWVEVKLRLDGASLYKQLRNKREE